jgi:hypothetical protein
MVSEERGRVLLVGRMYLRAGWWWPELRRELTSSVKLSMDQLHSAQAHKNTTVNSTRYNSEPERDDNNFYNLECSLSWSVPLFLLSLRLEQIQGQHECDCQQILRQLAELQRQSESNLMSSIASSVRDIADKKDHNGRNSAGAISRRFWDN